METPETSLLTKISEYLGSILAILGAVGGILLWLKRGRFKWLKFKEYWKSFAAMPKQLADVKAQVESIRSELVFEHDVTLRQQITVIGGDMKVLKDLVQIEVNTRRAMFRSSEIAIFECDKDGDLIWVNDAYEFLTGKSLDAVRGNGWRSQIHDEDRYKVIKEWERCVDEKRDFTMRYRCLTKAVVLNVGVTAVCIKDDEDNLLSFVGTVKRVNA